LASAIPTTTLAALRIARKPPARIGQKPFSIEPACQPTTQMPNANPEKPVMIEAAANPGSDTRWRARKAGDE
jgi:hypothetical protein